MQRSSIWRIASAAFVLGSIIYTSRSGAKAGQRKKEEAKFNDNVLPEYEEVFEKNLLIPDGWVFGAVWPTIYAGTTALSVYQALPGQLENPRFKRSMPWLVLNYACNTLFGRFFSDPNPESIVASNVITQLNLPAGLALHKALEIGQTEVEGPEKYLRWPISLYAGWLTAATVAGTPNIFLELGWWKPNEERDVPIATGILAATGALGYAVARKLNDPVYMIPFVAAFAGIATRQRDKHEPIASVAATLALVYTAVLAKWLPKGHFRPVGPAAPTPPPPVTLDITPSEEKALHEELTTA